MSDWIVNASDWKSTPAADLRRKYSSTRPKKVNGVFNASTIFYQNKLLRKLISLYILSGVPETWDMSYFWYTLYTWGYIGITDTSAGVLPLQCGLHGQNVFRRPTNMIFTNPVLGDFERTIDKDCVNFYLQYDYGSAMPMIRRYADLLAMCDSSLAVTLMNSKVTFIGLASDKTQAATMKNMYDTITSGEPAVYVNKDIGNPSNFFFNRVKENFVGQEIEIVKRGIINEFLTEIGVNNANTDKRERLNADEVNANNEEIEINTADWLENMKDACRRANAMFGLSLSIERRLPDPEEEPEETENEFSESD